MCDLLTPAQRAVLTRSFRDSHGMLPASDDALLAWAVAVAVLSLTSDDGLPPSLYRDHAANAIYDLEVNS